MVQPASSRWSSEASRPLRLQPAAQTTATRLHMRALTRPTAIKTASHSVAACSRGSLVVDESLMLWMRAMLGLFSAFFSCSGVMSAMKTR